MYTMPTINLELPVRGRMRTFSIALSDELHERVEELANKNKVSINSLVSTALANGDFLPGTEKNNSKDEPEKVDIVDLLARLRRK